MAGAYTPKFLCPWEAKMVAVSDEHLYYEHSHVDLKPWSWVVRLTDEAPDDRPWVSLPPLTFVGNNKQATVEAALSARRGHRNWELTRERWNTDVQEVGLTYC